MQTQISFQMTEYVVLNRYFCPCLHDGEKRGKSSTFERQKSPTNYNVYIYNRVIIGRQLFYIVFETSLTGTYFASEKRPLEFCKISMEVSK